MHGGIKVYAGGAAAARHYVEAGRGRADDYYLTEGSGIARRFRAAQGRVAECSPLSGDAYEAWVAGRDPQTDEPRGRLRSDPRAVRFVEVVLNGPKSWSLAAALHPDIAAAYEAAQDRAADQIIAWLSQHATTRVGPAGGQVQVPVDGLEAVTVRHYTSRAGDPHWHLHVQLLSRVFAAGKWRGLHTVGIRDSLKAINGIGHAAVATDPQLRAAFASHGYTLDATGELRQFAPHIGAFSARAAQIARNVDSYEREWMTAHPGNRPGPSLRQGWVARAWADGRPSKIAPQAGIELVERWRQELAALGYRDRDRPVDLRAPAIGGLDRTAAVDLVLTRLGTARSAWNVADIRGEVEQLIAAAGFVAPAAVRIELAEDLTARTVQRSLSLLDREGVPEHIRALTSTRVLDVEADLARRLAARHPRAARAALRPDPGGAELLSRSRSSQEEAVAVLAGTGRLVVLEGAAGTGKTTALAATRLVLHRQGQRLVVITPTLKAARTAECRTGAATGSAAWFAFQHGWRWNSEGAWARLSLGETDPVTGQPHTGPTGAALLTARDLLVVDEAGMLDQDTARAVLTVADECGARVALLGDRHQLAAVGRGGVLDLACRAVDPSAHLTLSKVHRFTVTDAAGTTRPDSTYAELSLAMRRNVAPDLLFDALLARGAIRLHPTELALQEALAELVDGAPARGEQPAVVADTRDQVAVLNDAVRRRLVASGRVDDRRVVTTRAGQRIGTGDRISTRRNDRDLQVANRELWIVTAVDRGGRLTLTPAAPERAERAGKRVLPREYVLEHVELAYAGTAYAVQGETARTAHLVVGEHTGAASAYVGMTRGREANTAHLVAADLDDARDQWLDAFARQSADLGPAHAADRAAQQARRYAPARRWGEVLVDLRRGWTAEQRCVDRLTLLQRRHDLLAELATASGPRTDMQVRLDALQQMTQRAAVAAQHAATEAETVDASVAYEARHGRDRLLAEWDADRDAARQAARVVRDGPGRLGLRRAAVIRAAAELTRWADSWRPYLPALPRDAAGLSEVAGWFDDRAAVSSALGAAALARVERLHPERDRLHAAATAAATRHRQATDALASARHELETSPADRPNPRSGPAAELAGIEWDLTAARRDLDTARAALARLAKDPAVLAQRSVRLEQERRAWRAEQQAERDRQPRTGSRSPALAVPSALPRPVPHRGQRPPRDDGRAIGR